MANYKIPVPGPKELVRRTGAGKYDANNPKYMHNESDPDLKGHKSAVVRRLQEKYGTPYGKLAQGLREAATRKYFSVAQAKKTLKAMR